MKAMQKNGLLIRTALILSMLLLAAAALTGKPYAHMLLSPKYGFYMVGSIVAIILLALNKVSTAVRLVLLVACFYVFGVALGIHPSPMCALTKAPLRYHLSGFIPPPMAVMAAVMLFLTVIANKVFCGWICPLGCMQEAVYLISRRPRKVKCSFGISNAVRTSLFVAFSFFLFAAQTNIYDFFNPFEIFHWHFTPYLTIIISLVAAASLVLYRPFCQFICPAGLVTWLFERMSLFAVRKNAARCTNCRQCIKASPCNAIQGLIENRIVVPDCFACGACIKACPEDALSFSLR
jgi:NAD-dependent dihydropyrimidine dehydrogenase PreA subunit